MNMLQFLFHLGLVGVLLLFFPKQVAVKPLLPPPQPPTLFLKPHNVFLSFCPLPSLPALSCAKPPVSMATSLADQGVTRRGRGSTEHILGGVETGVTVRFTDATTNPPCLTPWLLSGSSSDRRPGEDLPTVHPWSTFTECLSCWPVSMPAPAPQNSRKSSWSKKKNTR